MYSLLVVRFQEDSMQWLAEVVARRCSDKRLFFKISHNSQEMSFTGVSFLIKFQAWRLQLYLKKRYRCRCFLLEFWEIFKSFVEYNYFVEHLKLAATEKQARCSTEKLLWKFCENLMALFMTKFSFNKVTKSQLVCLQIFLERASIQMIYSRSYFLQTTQPAFTSSSSTTETSEQCVKSVQN